MHEHERDGLAWKVEGRSCPSSPSSPAGRSSCFGALAGGLVVHADRMRHNLDATGGSVMSEALVVALARHVGRETAYGVARAAADDARARGVTFEAAARARAEVTARLTPAELGDIFDAARHTGQCAALVDLFLAEPRAVPR